MKYQINQTTNNLKQSLQLSQMRIQTVLLKTTNKIYEIACIHLPEFTIHPCAMITCYCSLLDHFLIKISDVGKLKRAEQRI